MTPQRPAEEAVHVSPAAIVDDVGTVGTLAPLPGFTSFGDADAGHCVDGVCVLPDDGE